MSETPELKMDMPYICVTSADGKIFMQNGNVYDEKKNFIQKDVTVKSPDEISKFAIFNRENKDPVVLEAKPEPLIIVGKKEEVIPTQPAPVVVETSIPTPTFKEEAPVENITACPKCGKIFKSKNPRIEKGMLSKHMKLHKAVKK